MIFSIKNYIIKMKYQSKFTSRCEQSFIICQRELNSYRVLQINDI